METHREKEVTILADHRPDVKIRFGQYSDMEGLLELGKQFYEYAELGKLKLNYERTLFADVLAFYIANENYCLIVAEVDGMVVGSIAGNLTPWFLDPRQINAAETWWYVTPKYRGSVGPKLLNWFETWATKRQATMICVAGFYEKRLAALERLYARRGYKPLEVHFVKEL